MHTLICSHRRAADQFIRECVCEWEWEGKFSMTFIAMRKQREWMCLRECVHIRLSAIDHKWSKDFRYVAIDTCRAWGNRSDSILSWNLLMKRHLRMHIYIDFALEHNSAAWSEMFTVDMYICICRYELSWNINFCYFLHCLRFLYRYHWKLILSS
jgi:hypothetical protein